MKDFMETCPPSGQGVHGWVMKAAWFCRKSGMPPSEAIFQTKKQMSRDPIPENEVEEAVEKAYSYNCNSLFYKKKKVWPKPCREKIDQLSSSGFGVEKLLALSPCELDEKEMCSERILPLLFPGNPLICAGNKYSFFTKNLSDFNSNAHTFPLIVPSPMLSKFGRTKSGKLSQHTLDATGPRRYLVIEGDGTSKEQQASVLVYLAQRAPLTLVVDSGGKSLHGWFFVAGKTDDQLEPFFRTACILGADNGMWVRSQFVRMPGGLRENGNRQQILFFNPEVIDK